MKFFLERHWGAVAIGICVLYILLIWTAARVFRVCQEEIWEGQSKQREDER